MKTFRLLTLFAFLLVGCAATTPTAAPTAIVVEPTATIAPLPTATEIVELPTDAPQPTDIPATSTPDAFQQEQALIAPLVAPCKFANQEISYSPNKNWVVVTCYDDPLATKFARMDGSKQWSISFNHDYIEPYKADDRNMSKLLQEHFIPVEWTMNEDFVYLAAPALEEKLPYTSYDGLFQLDLSTGKISPILRPATAPLSASYAFKFSPSRTKLAYINQSLPSVTIAIDDTTTGDEQTIKLDARFGLAGGLLWSPDEKQLIVSAVDTNSNGGYCLIIYDFETKKNEYIFQQFGGAYLPVEWIDATTIYAKSYSGSWVIIDLTTKEVTPASAPTPTP